MTFTNEQLVMLDAMAYYSIFSDYLALNGASEIKDVVKEILNGHTTCFNDTLGLSDEDLGMSKILEHIQRDEQLKRLQIVYPTSEVDLVVNHAS